MRQALAQAEETPFVLSVNFIPDQYPVDAAFCANPKRMENIRSRTDITRLITSNVLSVAGEDFDHAFNFNDCVYFNETFCEDSTLMLLKLLRRCGCTEVSLAGFDGFSKQRANYYDAGYTRKQGNDIEAKKVAQILQGALAELKLHFVTPSLYESREVQQP